jgi:hypothetical protein
MDTTISSNYASNMQPVASYDGRINTSSPLIFIGGIPVSCKNSFARSRHFFQRSGTTLMRAMLDAHPDVRW